MAALLAGTFDAIEVDARRYATVAREMNVARQMNLAQGVKYDNAVS